MRAKEKREWKIARRAHHRRKSRATPSSGLDNNLYRSFTVRIRLEFAARPTESVIPRDNETKRRAAATRRIKFSILSANFTINHREQNLTNNMYWRRGQKKKYLETEGRKNGGGKMAKNSRLKRFQQLFRRHVICTSVCLSLLSPTMFTFFHLFFF